MSCRRHVMLYNNFSAYLKRRYGKRIKKICIDGGFTCPNRDGKCGTGGCIYCGERGAGEHITPEREISEQVKISIAALEDKADGFIAYFQNFTNTYASAEVLKARYDAALCDERIVALAIGTRPDCIDEERAALITSYKERVDVWVELGLQTASDETARVINRGYGKKTFEQAVEMLKKYEIPTVVHLMIGLPGEGDRECEELSEYISRFELFGVKIHSVYVMKNTALETMYRQGEYTPPTMDEYIRRAAYIIARLSPDTVLHRLTGDCPSGLLVAPDWNTEKNAILRGITEALEAKGLRQGSLFKKS